MSVKADVGVHQNLYSDRCSQCINKHCDILITRGSNKMQYLVLCKYYVFLTWSDADVQQAVQKHTQLSF